MLMSLYNVSINSKGLKYICESPGFIPLLWWLLSGKEYLLCSCVAMCSPPQLEEGGVGVLASGTIAVGCLLFENELPDSLASDSFSVLGWLLGMEEERSFIVATSLGSLRHWLVNGCPAPPPMTPHFRKPFGMSVLHSHFS